VPKFGMFFMRHLFNYTEPANTGWRTKKSRTLALNNL